MLLFVVGCASGGDVGSFRVVGIEGIAVAPSKALPPSMTPDEERPSSPELDIPREVELRVSRSEGARPFSILEGRVRVSYRGRRVAILNLAHKVKVAARELEDIRVPFRLSMTRNSQSLALLDALRRGEWEHIAVDWEFKVGSGLWRGEVSQPSVPLSLIYRENSKY